jgi:hypothetical protein
MTEIKKIGREEDRTREQFTAEIIRHPPGEPGHVYLAQAIAQVRGNTLGDLQAFVADFVWESTP